MKTSNQLHVRTIRQCIIPANRRAIVQRVSERSFFILKAETSKGEMQSTQPMSLFLEPGDFVQM